MFIKFKSFNDKIYKVEIQLPNTDNQEITLEGENPFTLSYNLPTEDCFKPVIYSSCEINMLINQIDTRLFKSYAQLCPIIFYEEKTDLSYDIIWKGFLSPDVFSTSIDNYVKDINLAGVDGLSTLEYYTNDIPKDESILIIDLLKQIINKAGYNHFVLPNNFKITSDKYVLDMARLNNFWGDDTTYKDMLEDICNWLRISLYVYQDVVYGFDNEIFQTTNNYIDVNGDTITNVEPPFNKFDFDLINIDNFNSSVAGSIFYKQCKVESKYDLTEGLIPNLLKEGIEFENDEFLASFKIPDSTEVVYVDLKSRENEVNWKLFGENPTNSVEFLTQRGAYAVKYIAPDKDFTFEGVRITTNGDYTNANAYKGGNRRTENILNGYEGNAYSSFPPPENRCVFMTERNPKKYVTNITEGKSFSLSTNSFLKIGGSFTYGNGNFPNANGEITIPMIIRVGDWYLCSYHLDSVSNRYDSVQYHWIHAKHDVVQAMEPLALIHIKDGKMVSGIEDKRYTYFPIALPTTNGKDRCLNGDVEMSILATLRETSIDNPYDNINISNIELSIVERISNKDDIEHSAVLSDNISGAVKNVNFNVVSFDKAQSVQNVPFMLQRRDTTNRDLIHIYQYISGECTSLVQGTYTYVLQFGNSPEEYCIAQNLCQYSEPSLTLETTMNDIFRYNPNNEIQTPWGKMRMLSCTYDFKRNTTQVSLIEKKDFSI